MPVRPKAKPRPWNKLTSKPSGSYTRERDPFYHTNRWKKASKRFLFNNPLCAECRRQGIITEAKVTDHIIPKSICKDPWDQRNWQPLCLKCHARKSGRDKQLIQQHHNEDK